MSLDFLNIMKQALEEKLSEEQQDKPSNDKSKWSVSEKPKFPGFICFERESGYTSLIEILKIQEINYDKGQGIRFEMYNRDTLTFCCNDSTIEKALEILSEHYRK